MISIVNGRYKVWTKKVGDGKIKVLLTRTVAPDFHMTISNVLRTSCPTKESNFITMTSWVVATLMSLPILCYGRYQDMLKK